ncbi:MAG: hypothetical protein ACAI35_17575 [Candidatus Methylacidiphilales bacterium]|nr:hypothetical protein [Candidatus Methylacidiphilales bacterium]
MANGSLVGWLKVTFTRWKGAPANSKLGYAKGKWNSEKLAVLEAAVSEGSLVKHDGRYYLKENAPPSPAEKFAGELKSGGGIRTLSQLGARNGRLPAPRQAALNELLDSGRAVRKGKYIALSSMLPTEESEAARVIQFLCKPGVLHAEKSLLKAVRHPLFEEKLLRKVLGRLSDSRELVRWEVAGHRSLGYVYGLPATGVSVSALKTENNPSSQPVSADEASLTKTILSAYDNIKTRTGLPDVYISQLCKEAGLTMEKLKAWVHVHVIKQGEGTLGTGDWAACSPEERSGAIDLRGQPRLLVRLAD